MSDMDATEPDTLPPQMPAFAFQDSKSAEQHRVGDRMAARPRYASMTPKGELLTILNAPAGQMSSATPRHEIDAACALKPAPVVEVDCRDGEAAVAVQQHKRVVAD